MVFTAMLLLLLPLIAMQFTTEVNWAIGDFIVAGVLLFGTILFLELILKVVPIKNYRIGLIALLFILLFLLWAELAVGIFGTPFAGS